MPQILARSKGFEILVDQDKAFEFKQGKNISIQDILESDEIFKNVQKGERASSNDLKKAFDTDDINQVAKLIILKGELLIDASKRKELLDEKKKQVIYEISQNAIDPKTGIVHPPDRIESALTESGVKIDVNKSLQDQVKEAVEKINSILPISMEKVKVSIRIPSRFSGKCYGVLNKIPNAKPEFDNSGNLNAILEVSGAQKEQLKKELFNICGQDLEFIDL